MKVATPPWRALLQLVAGPSLAFKDASRWYSKTNLIVSIMIAALIFVMGLFPLYQIKQGVTALDGDNVGEVYEFIKKSVNQQQALHYLAQQGRSQNTEKSQEESPFPSLPFPITIDEGVPAQDNIENILKDFDIRTENNNCTDCVKLRYNNGYWSWLPQIGKIVAGQDFVDHAKDYQAFTERLQYELINRQPPAIVIGVPSLGEEVKNLTLRSLYIMTHLLFFVFVGVIALGAGGFVGAKWDFYRSMGVLEYITSAQHRPWVLYMSMIGKILRWVVLAYVGMVLALTLYGRHLSWPVVISMFPFIISLFIFSSLWGILTTVLFHHPKGRFFAKVLLSPFTILFTWIVRLAVVWSAMKSKELIGALDGFQALLDYWPVLWVIMPALWLASFGLFVLINQKIGVRGEGLRETK